MGFGGISIWQLLIILIIFFMLFGSKKLKNLGSDLGSAIKGFKRSVQDGNEQLESIDKDPKTSTNYSNKSSDKNSPSSD